MKARDYYEAPNYNTLGELEFEDTYDYQAWEWERRNEIEYTEYDDFIQDFQDDYDNEDYLEFLISNEPIPLNL